MLNVYKVINLLNYKHKILEIIFQTYCYYSNHFFLYNGILSIIIPNLTKPNLFIIMSILIYYTLTHYYIVVY